MKCTGAISTLLVENFEPVIRHKPSMPLTTLQKGQLKALLRKGTLKLDERLYQIKLRYDEEDETELLIRGLPFESVLEVEAPKEFAVQVKARNNH